MMDSKKLRSYTIERDSKRGVDIYRDAFTKHLICEKPIEQETKPVKTAKEKAK